MNPPCDVTAVVTDVKRLLQVDNPRMTLSACVSVMPVSVLSVCDDITTPPPHFTPTLLVVFNQINPIVDLTFAEKAWYLLATPNSRLTMFVRSPSAPPPPVTSTCHREYPLTIGACIFRT